jgi:hypothetical protein
MYDDFAKMTNSLASLDEADSAYKPHEASLISTRHAPSVTDQ